ncbi:MAG: hypothetical protein FJ117_02470 [Deltaproteobacteria bacterium]|nr:hypothetical protein [Deltaproteobacteria bacterium]
MEERDLLNTKIKDLLAQRRWTGVREVLQEIPAPDIADSLLNLDKQGHILLFRLLPRPSAGRGSWPPIP